MQSSRSIEICAVCVHCLLLYCREERTRDTAQYCRHAIMRSRINCPIQKTHSESTACHVPPRQEWHAELHRAWH